VTNGSHPRWARAIVIAAATLAVAVAFATSDEGTSSNPETSEAIRLDFVYSSDTQQFLEPLIEEFNAEEATYGGRRIVVEGNVLNSGVAESEISQGRLEPVIWGPVSSLWGRLLTHHTGEQWVDDENPSIVRSPQVIAMWEPLARALGWPDEPIGWNDILTLATDPDGWASRGKPAYGSLKLGHPNPNSSTSGLSAVAAMYYALAGGWTPEELEKPGVRRAVRQVQRSVVHYGQSADDLLAQMAKYGPGYAHAVAVQEEDMLQFNVTTDGEDLVAVFPAEGPFVADYPFMVLRAPWVDADEREAAELFRRWLLPKISPELAAEYYLRAPGSPRTVAPIDTAHGTDPTQPERTIELPPPEALATIQENWNADRKPANIMLVVDTSGSVGQNRLLEPQQEALKAFLDALRPNDRVGLVTFGTKVFQPVPLASFGKNEEALRQAVDDLLPSGKSALYDAARKGVSAVDALEDATRINAVVILSDGGDEGSSLTLDELVRQAEAACSAEGRAIPIFTVAHGPEADRQALARIAAACQGRMLTANPDEVVDVFEDLRLLF
jgi:Ca-activated chloride channel family protein